VILLTKNETKNAVKREIRWEVWLWGVCCCTSVLTGKLSENIVLPLEHEINGF